MANSIQSCVPEVYNMTAHDSIKINVMKMETQGEGNYASTAFSDTRDQETDQGLTLSPKIQSSDPWLFDAAGTFGDQDLNALLGPVEFDLVVEEARKNGMELDALFNDQYQLPEPPAKKRRLTGELSKESFLHFESNEAACAHGTSSVPPRISEPAPQPTSDAPPSLQRSGIASREAETSPAAVRPARPLCQSSELISDAENPILPADFQGVKSFVGDQWLHEVGTQVFDSFDGDGSLFGDYVSNKEDSIKYSPITEPSCADQEATFGGTKASTAPAVIWDPDVPLTSVEMGLTTTESVTRKKPIPRIRKNRNPQIRNTPKPSKLQAIDLALQAELSKLDQKYCPRFSRPSLQNLTSNRQNGSSVLERDFGQTTPSSALRRSLSLPLSILCALATPIHLDSITSCIQKSKALLTSKETGFTRQQNITPPAVPTQLENLLNSLERKFQTDEKFRVSTVTWLVSRLASINNESNDGNDEEQHDDLENYNTVDDLKELIRREREEHDEKVNSLQDENAGLRVQRDHAVEEAGAFRKAWLAVNH